jgi:hypothetical protein
MEHVFGGLLEISFAGESGERNFFGEKVDFQDITFVECVFKITFPAAVMFEGWTNVPTNFAVLPEGSACIGGDMGDNPGAWWGEWSAVEIKVPKE